MPQDCGEEVDIADIGAKLLIEAYMPMQLAMMVITLQRQVDDLRTTLDQVHTITSPST